MRKLIVSMLVIAVILAVMVPGIAFATATTYEAPMVMVDDGSNSIYRLPTYAGVTYFYRWSTIEPYFASGKLTGLPVLTPEELEDIVGIPFDQRMGYLRWLRMQ